ncbi:MAG: class I SAM-dependent methyltransferase [Candidatus Helarchaeota archaeon]
MSWKLSHYFNDFTKYYQVKVLERCRGKKILEYGCGSGSLAIPLAFIGKKIIGIDISESGIEVAKKQKRENNLNNIDFFVMDAEEMSFDDNSFDVVCGTGILHHLNIKNAIKEIKRILKSDGTAIFLEPMGVNPLMTLLRKINPNLVTPNEHPLRNNDLKLFDLQFRNTNYDFFYLISLLLLPLGGSRIFKFLHDTFVKIDALIFRLFPQVKRFAWQVVMVLDNPIK